MDQLPKEILESILNYCDDKTKRLARQSCKKWFGLIDYRDFTLYLTKKSDWPQIVDQLSSYTKPISLSFCKMPMKQLRDFNEHLLRLTNLTDLNFEHLDHAEKNLEAEWLKLTALPNLHSVNVQHYWYTIPSEALLSLPNLTKFDQSWEEDGENLEEQKAFRRWTNLQSCWITPNGIQELDLFDSYNTKLTNLYLRGTPGKWFNQLGNIKYLRLELESKEPFSLKSLTALESLVLHKLQIHELNSTKLTFLELFSVEEKYIEKAVDKLMNLKEFIFDFKKNDNAGGNEENEEIRTDGRSYQWLTALTRLEYLNIDPIEANGLAFVSTRLTKLRIAVKKPIDLSHVSRFVSLKDLFLGGNDKTLQDLSLLSIMTQLESLQIGLRQGTSELNFLSSMTNLTWLYLSHCSSSNISHLTNLISLFYIDNYQFAGLEGLSKLQELEIRNSEGVVDFDYSFVSKLTTLQCLSFFPRRKYDCKYFSTLTNLDSLRFHEVTSEEDYSYLSTLTKLTGLVIRSGPPSGKILNLPTSLQVLEVTFSDPEQEEADGYDDSDTGFSNITEPLLARLTNLFKYAFD